MPWYGALKARETFFQQGDPEELWECSLPEDLGLRRGWGGKQGLDLGGVRKPHKGVGFCPKRHQVLEDRVPRAQQKLEHGGKTKGGLWMTQGFQAWIPRGAVINRTWRQTAWD